MTVTDQEENSGDCINVSLRSPFLRVHTTTQYGPVFKLNVFKLLRLLAFEKLCGSVDGRRECSSSDAF